MSKCTVMLNGLSNKDITTINNASILHNIVIIKVPAHTGLDSNEEADKLAKVAANKSQGHVNLIKNSLSSITNEIIFKLMK